MSQIAACEVCGFDLSHTVTTDPASRLNWSPPVELKFNRRTAYWDVPYAPKEQVSDEYYPE